MAHRGLLASQHAHEIDTDAGEPQGLTERARFVRQHA